LFIICIIRIISIKFGALLFLFSVSDDREKGEDNKNSLRKFSSFLSVLVAIFELSSKQKLQSSPVISELSHSSSGFNSYKLIY
jgi:hypothetical protein